MDSQSDMFLTLLISQYFVCHNLIVPFLGTHMGCSAYFYVLITGTILTDHTPTVHSLAKPLAGIMALSLIICMSLYIFDLQDAAYVFGNIAGVCNMISFSIEYTSMLSTIIFKKPMQLDIPEDILDKIEIEPLKPLTPKRKKSKEPHHA